MYRSAKQIPDDQGPRGEGHKNSNARGSDLRTVGSSAEALSDEPGTPLRLAIIDDHLILRQGLRALLEMESDLEVVGEAGDSARALELVRQEKPDVVISDVALPGRSGLDIIGELRSCCPQVRILVLTAHGSEEYIRVALNARADGYVLKDSSREELLHAIRLVAKGEQYLCRTVAARVVNGYLDGGQRSGERGPATVTDRERQVLTYIAKGLPNKLIARNLGLSVKTVEKHRSNLMRKLSLHNTAEVTMYAIKNGFVDADEIAQNPR
jgi:two-component system response regulator NreC